MILLVKMLLAHLIGDFILQPESTVRAKERYKLKSYHLYLHCLLHAALVFVLVREVQFWKWALILGVFHFAIDAIKLLIQNYKTKRTYFFLDQIFHVFSILLVWMWYSEMTFIPAFYMSEKVILFFTMIVFLTQPVSIAVKIFISKWSPHTEDNNNDSLQSAGKYIGILERLFVFAFVITGHFEAIGFLIAAKSVFRFGDLKEARDRKLTEYILIGTLLSFGIAMLAGIIYTTFSSSVSF